jgi:hypothetical protein
MSSLLRKTKNLQVVKTLNALLRRRGYRGRLARRRRLNGRTLLQTVPAGDVGVFYFEHVHWYILELFNRLARTELLLR